MRRGAKVLAFGGGGGGRSGGEAGEEECSSGEGRYLVKSKKSRYSAGFAWRPIAVTLIYLVGSVVVSVAGTSPWTRRPPSSGGPKISCPPSSSASWAATGHGKIPGRGRTLSSGPMGANLQEEFPCDSTLQPMRTMKGWRGRGAATTTSTGTRGLRRRSPRHSGNARGKKRESWRNIWEEGAGVRSRVGAGVWSMRHRGLNRRRGTETHEYTGHHNLSICHQCRGGFWLQGRQRCGRRKSRWRTGGGGGAESAENRAMLRGYTAEHQECGG